MDTSTPNTLSRRRFLAGSAGAAAIATIGLDSALRSGAYAAPGVATSAYPFTLGVASGDPDHRSVVLWTRLAPDPFDPAALGDRTVPVVWELFADEGLRLPVNRGVVLARPGDGHAVHVEVGGLLPDRWYWYRFRTTKLDGDHVSRIGRTRTFPVPGFGGSRMRFGLTSCQHFEQGYYTAFQHMAVDDLDFVFQVGDYIYEGAAGPIGPGRPRQHDGPEPMDLRAYRNRHALYKTDEHLQAAHANFPWIVTWDDHEVENNYADAISENEAPEAEFLARRAAAYQGYWEHQPLRAASKPKGPDMGLYRRLSYGGLASLNVLDTRQYRSDQACGDGTDNVPCGDWADPARTIMGEQQEAWLIDGLGRSRAPWNVVAQQVFFAERDFLVGEGKRLSMDGWDGYPAARARLLSAVQERKVKGLTVLTGDVHRHYAADIKANFDDQASPTLGTELVCTSVTTGGDGSEDMQDALKLESPHVKYSRNRRGYVRCDVTPTTYRTDFLTVPFVSTPGAPIAVDRSFVVEAGQPGLKPA